MHSKGDWSWIPQEAANRGLSVPQLAQLLDVEPQTVHYWIHGRNDPHLPSALKLAAIFFGGSVEQLAERAGFDRAGILREVAAQMEGLSLRRGGADWLPSRQAGEVGGGHDAGGLPQDERSGHIVQPTATTT